MKTCLKYLLRASAVISLTGSVYATQSIYITDGDNIGGAADFASSTSGTAKETIIGVDGWSILVATGIASPPGGSGGTVELPKLNLSISANYTGTGGAGSTLDIYFGSDGFGPSSTSFNAILNGHVGLGTGLGVTYNTWDVSGSGVPSVLNPIPVGANTLTSSGTVSPNGTGDYNNVSVGGPVNLASYSLGEHVTLSGNAGGTDYSLQPSLAPVPEPSVMTLAIVAAGAFGMMRRRR